MGQRRNVREGERHKRRLGFPRLKLTGAVKGTWVYDSWADAAKGSMGREETSLRMQHVRVSIVSPNPRAVAVPGGSCQGVWGRTGGSSS